jgi:hypothetical protein
MRDKHPGSATLERIKRVPVAKGLQSRNEIILNGPDPGLIASSRRGKNSHTYEGWKLEIVNDRPDSGRKALKHAH